jgi:DNA polymerase
MASKRELLDRLKQRILDELHDNLSKKAKNLVFGKGNPDAPILFVGEAPGQKEDEQGIPFVGRAGKELDKLLNGIGLTLDDIYIANVLKYRPPNNRDPLPQEIEQHKPYLIEQIKIIKPIIIATLGNYSTKLLLADFDVKDMQKIRGVTQIHGKSHDVKFDGQKVLLIPLYHPAAMLYRPQYRPQLEKDFTTMKSIIQTHLKPAEKVIFKQSKSTSQSSLQAFLK